MIDFWGVSGLAIFQGVFLESQTQFTRVVERGTVSIPRIEDIAPNMERSKALKLCHGFQKANVLNNQSLLTHFPKHHLHYRNLKGSKKLEERVVRSGSRRSHHAHSIRVPSPLQLGIQERLQCPCWRHGLPKFSMVSNGLQIDILGWFPGKGRLNSAHQRIQWARWEKPNLNQEKVNSELPNQDSVVEHHMCCILKTNCPVIATCSELPAFTPQTDLLHVLPSHGKVNVLLLTWHNKECILLYAEFPLWIAWRTEV